jgi:Protein of unknown function (DUF2934)
VGENKFRDTICDLVSEMLVASGFPNDGNLRDGVVTIIDALCDYREEGRRLYPQVLITGDLKSLCQTVPFSKYIEVGRGSPSARIFGQALKETAPLATGAWSTYIEIGREELSYGLLSVEASMLSSSLDQSLCGDSSAEGLVGRFVLLRSVGNRVVRVKNATTTQLIDFSLRPAMLVDDQAMNVLMRNLVKKVSDDLSIQMRNFFQRILEMSLPFSHGNLIGVLDLAPLSEKEIKDAAHQLWIMEGCPNGRSLEHWSRAREPVINRLRSISKGTFLEPLIDLNNVVSVAAQEVGGEAMMRSYASLVRNMINNDGITIFTNDGRIVGYHVFITAGADVGEREGGARRGAFAAMKASGLFRCCFFKSQDGFMEAVEGF